MIATDKAMLR